MPTRVFSTPVTTKNKHRKEDPSGRTGRELYPGIFSFAPWVGEPKNVCLHKICMIQKVAGTDPKNFTYNMKR